MNSTCLYSKLLLSTLRPETVTNTTRGPLTTKEDYQGAMFFTIATVCVYGLSIVAFIAGHLQKGHMNKDEENQISNYLKRMHLGEPGKGDREYHVIRFKSRLLADSAFGQRHNRRESLVPRGPHNFVMQRGDSAYGPLSSDGSDCNDASDEGDGGRGCSGGESPFNGDCMQVVDERPASSPSGFGYSRARRQGIAGISFERCGSTGDRGGEATSSAGPQRPRLVQLSLPKIEEDEQSSGSSESLLSCERRGSSESQPSSPGQNILDKLSANQRTDSLGSESAALQRSASDNHSTSKKDSQLTNRQQALIHTQPVSINSNREDFGESLEEKDRSGHDTEKADGKKPIPFSKHAAK